MRYVIQFLCFGVLFAAMPATSVADSLSIDLNSDAARINYFHEFSRRPLSLDGGWLHHQDKGDIMDVGLHRIGNAGSGQNPVHTGIGAKLFFINPDDNAVPPGQDSDGSALAIGGFFRYRFPQYHRVGIAGHVYFAPDVITFSDVDQYFEVSANASYDILRDAWAYLGLRVANADFDDGGDLSIDTGMHLGIQMRF